ncbi:Cardiolipin synthase B [Acaryochloris thomasi RCC1774]|uniref:Cardiolipin synthase B n=1 Tax=Acaryochloris thomasi RCC1774 TaxID=1764569 RepID=A0A2W1JHK2_9CYAN|nr:DISARM system phospholipase D-like protein DrmC [Acaryochloris thomasi]PZD73030.1 Cardiolipin synthase B [Acaryochloris thomasi RCC1774]
MRPLSPRLLAHIHRVAQQLPQSVLSTVANFLADVPQATDSKTAWLPLLQQLPKPVWRRAFTDLLAVWSEDNPVLQGESLATALCSAHYSIERAEEALNIEIVWTGPEVSRIPVRRTEQVLLQLIRVASEELTLASFALYKVPTLTQALIAALDRGVQVRIIAETTAGDTVVPFGVKAGLGQEVAMRAEVYEWDKAKRPKDKAGRQGSLHMKVAISDRQRLFITSANLTGYAMLLNMEMGLLVNGKALSCQVSEHFDQLIQQEIIALVDH